MKWLIRAGTRSCMSALGVLVLLSGLPQAIGRPSVAPPSARATAPAHQARIPSPTPHRAAKPLPVPVAPPKAEPSEASAPVAPPLPPPSSPASLFAGLGAWVDLYDVDVLPVRKTVETLRRNGVRTLYIQASRSNTRHAVPRSVAIWLYWAHHAGLKVVAWYLPTYSDVRFDARRTVYIARYHYRAYRFDGIGIDIEYKGAVPRVSWWNRAVVKHFRGVRRALGYRYPIAAIVPPPLQMRLARSYWLGFPWQPLAKQASTMMLMSYWSDRAGCPRIRIHCAYEYTYWNVRMARQLIKSRVPINVIGGIGDTIRGKQLFDFIRGAIAARAIGAGIYDVATTRRDFWRGLRLLNALGK
jgi:hypothetical protein